eukprot:4753998-Amphidinium_carterae.1
MDQPRAGSSQASVSILTYRSALQHMWLCKRSQYFLTVDDGDSDRERTILRGSCTASGFTPNRLSSKSGEKKRTQKPQSANPPQDIKQNRPDPPGCTLPAP